jgi:nitroreductase
MSQGTKVQYTFLKYGKEDLMGLEPDILGAVLRERVHHMIEVPLYPTLLRWTGKPHPGFGMQAQLVFDVWREKGLPEDSEDLRWARRYLDIAAQIRHGERPALDEPLPEPFSDEEMKVVQKLIWGRRSMRDWVKKEIPEWMVERVLEAGRAAPIGCNLGHLRFVVLTKPGEKALIRSDISTANAAVIIVICHDKRVAKAVDQDRFVPQNPGFDAAAAGDHMLLMAHALGLGAVWLSEMKKTSKTEDTGEKFRKAYGLPGYLEVDLHVALGWPAIGSIKSARRPLSEMVIRK